MPGLVGAVRCDGGTRLAEGDFGEARPSPFQLAVGCPLGG
jgi:hypothetical protein